MTATNEALAPSRPEGVPARPDFADVYRDQLTSIWRYVRSRVPGHHEAQDVTSEVFVRAFRSWTRYDVARGEVAPWLFRIAQRTVVDWFRQAGRGDRPDPEAVARESGSAESPEAAVVRRAELERLERALGELGDRERDAIALRFGGCLTFSELGAVLELSAPAAKMLVWRTINKLRVFFREEEVPAAEREPASVGGRGEAARTGRAADTGVDRLLDVLAVAHSHEVPPELPDRIASCVGCSNRVEKRARRGPPSGHSGSTLDADSNRDQRSKAGPPIGGRRTRREASGAMIARQLGIVPFVGLSWALLAPSCLACVGGLLPFLGMFGLASIAGLSSHDVGLAVAPFALTPVWLGYRRHRNLLPLLLGILGVAGIIVHNLGHFATWPTTALDAGVYEVVWGYGVRLGVTLLLAGTVLNVVAVATWISRQRRGLALALAEGRPVPSTAPRRGGL